MPERDGEHDRPEQDPHHALNNPAGDPDPTEWPDPYDKRPDPLDSETDDGAPGHEQGHALPGATSTSQPHPDEDLEAPDAKAPDRDKLDD
jgi:hypothetical protein